MVRCRKSAQGAYLGYADGAVPIPFWYLRHLGFDAVCMEALIAAVAQQEQSLIVSLATQLTELHRGRRGGGEHWKDVFRLKTR